MTAGPGTRLGRYEIRSKIGAGGMGEVYLAQDTKLDRTVALKVLPAELASNRDRLRRFAQEAKAAAALNHPNIAHIYEVDESEGTSFIAMEFIDGVTLRQLVHERQTELPKLLRYLQHVAEGLAKAHPAGIVHRDLKPDNIMVSHEGHAKILDFGLAKLIAPPQVSSGSSEVETAILSQYSQPGIVMGTVGYMSPEQAQGRVREIDHRSDIFSFGCILFEAVTGRKPFEGSDAIDSLNKIIRETAPSVRDLNPAAPADLQRIVRRCLAKDREERYQTIKDVAIELKDVRRELQSTGIDTMAASASEIAASPSGSASRGSLNAESQTSQTRASSAEYLLTGIRRHKAAVVVGVVTLVAVVAGVGFALYKFADGGKAGKPIFENLTVTRITTSNRALEANISPDGKYVVYLEMGDDGSRGLFVKQTATGNTIPIVPPTKGNVLKDTSFSPDGNFVYYRFTDRTRAESLYQVSSVGGTPKKVIDDCDSAAAVSPDGRKLAFMRYQSHSASSIFVANVDGTGARALATLDGDGWFPEAGPAWSPDGKTIATAAAIISVGGVVSMRLRGIDAESGTMRELSPKTWVAAGRVVWMPDGAALALIATERTDEAGAQVWRVSYPSGEAGRITNDVHGYDETSLGVTADGRTLVTVTRQTLSRIETIPAGGDSTRPARLTTAEANQEGFYGFALAPDGRIVFSSFEGGQFDLWIMNADGGGRRRLTSDTHFEADPSLSPDRRYVLFRSNRPDGAAVMRLWRMDIDGSNPIQLPAMTDLAPHVSPDGRWVIYSAWSVSDKREVLWKVSIEGSEPVRLTDYHTYEASYSPNGQWIGCNFRDEQLKLQHGIVPATGGRPVRQFRFPLFQYQRVRWTPDGVHLSYIGAPPDPSNIWLQPVAGGEARKLTDFKSDYIYRHAWSSDGKTLVLARGRPAHDVVLLKDSR